MKKILCLALVSVMMLACVLSASAAATDGYVTNGLEAFYDAAENTDATKWADLSGKGNDIVDLPNTDTCKFVDGAYLNTATKVMFPQGVVDVMNEKDSWTTEFVFGALEVTGTTWGTLANSTNDKYSLYYIGNGTAIFLKNNGSAANARPSYTLANGYADLANKTVSVTFEKGVASKIYIDGVEVASAVPAEAIQIADFFFGHDDPTKSHTTEYKAMRFYSRALTADEVAQNAAADKAVDTPPATEPTEPTTPPATGDAGMVFALIALVAMAGVVVVKKNAR